MKLFDDVFVIFNFRFTADQFENLRGKTSRLELAWQRSIVKTFNGCSLIKLFEQEREKVNRSSDVKKNSRRTKKAFLSTKVDPAERLDASSKLNLVTKRLRPLVTGCSPFRKDHTNWHTWELRFITS